MVYGDLSVRDVMPENVPGYDDDVDLEESLFSTAVPDGYTTSE